MIDKFLVKSNSVFKKPFLLIMISVILTIIFGYGVTKLKIDNDTASMLPDSNIYKAEKNYYEREDKFGLSDAVIIAFQSTALPKEVDKDTFENKIINLANDKNDGKFVRKFYKEKDGKLFLKDKISASSKVKLIKIFENIGYKGSVYSYDFLNYIYGLRKKFVVLGSNLQINYFIKTFGINENDAKSLLTAINQSGISKDNYKKELKNLLSDKNKLINECFLDPALADKISKTSFIRIDLKEVYDYSIDPIKKINDVISVDYMENVNDELQTKKIVPDIDNVGITEENIKVLPKRIASWDIYQNGIVSNDATITPMVIELRTTNNVIKSKILDDINKVITENKKDNVETYLDGESVITKEIADSSRSDMGFLLPLVFLVIILILYFCFRNFEGVIYPLIVVILSIVWGLGFMAFCNVPMNLVSSVMPVLLVAITSAYAIHQLNHYFLDHSHDKLDIIIRNMRVVGLAVAISGLTVMIGFGSLSVERFVPIRNFGIFTAIADFLAILIALYFLPALLLSNKRPKKSFLHENRKDFVGKILNFLKKLNNHYSKAIIVSSIIISVVFAAGIYFVKSEMNMVSFFKDDSPIKVTDTLLNERLAGTQAITVIMDSDLKPILERSNSDSPASEPVSLTTPEVLNEIDRFSKDIVKDFPLVQKVTSLADQMKKINQEMNGSGNPNYYKIPETKELISQYLLLSSGDLTSMLTSNNDKLKISLTMKSTGTEEIKKVKDYCDKYFTKEFKEKNHLQVNVVGGSLLSWVANSLMVEGQIISIILCIIIVFVLLLIVFRSFIISLIALIPNVITILINFGTLGFFNIPLNAGTAMVSSLAIGIGVDYAIHFITWYRHEIEKQKDIEKAIDATIIHKGRAILYNMLVIFGGFLVLAFSKFIPLIQFGLLVALCMLTTAFGALVIIPAIMKVLAKKDYKFLYMGIKK